MIEPSRPAGPLGIQYAIELYTCAADRIADCASVEARLRAVGRQIGATILSGHFHQFDPTGVSGVLVLSESHLAIHTWPEHRYAAVDLFTCGPRLLDGDAAAEHLARALGAQRTRTERAERGVFE